MITSMRRMAAPAGGFGAGDLDILARNVERPVRILEKEVMMVTDVGVEIRVAGIHHDLAQQPCLDELVQRIVDGSERHPDCRLDRFAVQLLGGDVPVTLLEQESGQRQPLPGRPRSNSGINR